MRTRKILLPTLKLMFISIIICSSQCTATNVIHWFNNTAIIFQFFRSVNYVYYVTIYN